jgi:hypothetical protein
MFRRLITFCLVGALVGQFVMVMPIAHANGSVVIAQLQTNGSGSGTATQEYISLYNNSTLPIDVTNWCVEYSSASDATKTSLTCILAPEPSTRINIASNTYARFATTEFRTVHEAFVADAIFSGGMSSTSGHIRLFDSNNVEVDKVGWGAAANPEQTAATAHANGKILERKKAGNIYQDTGNNAADFSEATLVSIPPSGLYEEVIADICQNIAGEQSVLPVGYMLDEAGLCLLDVCDNLEGLQVALPNGYRVVNGVDCEPEPLESATILLTELLPNATSYDTGNEYIELYNPNDRAVNLAGYKLQLGPAYSKQHILTDILMEPLAYFSLSDSLSGLILPNTSASVRLVAPAGNMVSETPAYGAPIENESWALIDDVWQYTNRPTIAAANLASVVIEEDEDTEVAPLAPCPVGKIRNPKTNRCKNIEADEEIKPCEAGQIRNPETNRCRSTVSSSSLTPCREGQERNPETNRCRKSTGTASSLATVKDVSTKPLQDNTKWLLALVVGLGALSYAIYEWRSEIKQFMQKIKPGLLKVGR